MLLTYRDAYHYVEVERFKVSLFLKKTKSGNVDIAEYGSVVQVSTEYTLYS